MKAELTSQATACLTIMLLSWLRTICVLLLAAIFV